jgi:addiction module HigA family antidote
MNKVTVHPGGFIRRNYIDALGIKAAELALSLEVSESTVSRLLHEKIDLSPQLAVRLSKVLGQSAESWMTMQTNFTLARAREALATWQPTYRVTEDGLVAVSDGASGKKTRGGSSAAA